MINISGKCSSSSRLSYFCVRCCCKTSYTIFQHLSTRLILFVYLLNTFWCPSSFATAFSVINIDRGSLLISTRIVFPLILFFERHIVCSLFSVHRHKHTFLLARGCFHTMCVFWCICVVVVWCGGVAYIYIICAREHVYHPIPFHTRPMLYNVQPQQFL